MDQATILEILKNNNAPATLENINRVMQQSGGGSRATELLGRSMGLQGGYDESGPGMDLILDKHMQNTARSGIAPNMEPQIDPNSESNGAPQNGGAVARAPAPAPVRSGRGIAPSVEPPPTSGNVNTPVSPSTSSSGNPNVLDGSMSRGYLNETANREAANREPGSDMLPWLLGGGGTLAALYAWLTGSEPGAPPIAAPNAQITGANPNQKRIGYEPKLTGPAPQLTDESGPKMESGAPVPPKQPVGGPAAPQTPDDVAKMKGKVSIENNKAKILDQMRGVKSVSDLDLVAQDFGLTDEQAYAMHKEANAAPTANARGKGAGAGGAAANNNTKSLIEALRAFRSMR